MITQLALNLELDKMLDSLAHLPLADLIQPDCPPPIPMVFPSAPSVILPGASMLNRTQRDIDLVTIGSSLLFRSGYTTELRTMNVSPTNPTYWGNSFNGTQIAPYRSNLHYEDLNQPLPAHKNLFYHLFRAAVDIDKPILVEFDVSHFIGLMPEEFKLQFVKKNLDELVFSFLLNLDLVQKHIVRKYQRKLRVFVLGQSFITIANKEPKELIDTVNLINARLRKFARAAGIAYVIPSGITYPVEDMIYSSDLFFKQSVMKPDTTPSNQTLNKVAVLLQNVCKTICIQDKLVPDPNSYLLGAR